MQDNGIVDLAITTVKNEWAVQGLHRGSFEDPHIYLSPQLCFLVFLITPGVSICHVKAQIDESCKPVLPPSISSFSKPYRLLDLHPYELLHYCDNDTN